MPETTETAVLRVERHSDGRIWVITMNRPERLNTLGGGMSSRLTEVFEDFRDDSTARVAILTGAGDRAFCVGADLKEAAEARVAAVAAGDPPIANRVRRWPTKRMAPLAEGLELWKPVIAAINGLALAGGFMVAMQADIRIMADHARIGIPETRWNMSGAGWIAPLTRQIGLGNALELALWGDTQYTAQRAYEIGWAQKVVPLAELMPTAMDYANRMLDLAPRAVANIKEMIYRGYYTEPVAANLYGRWLEQNLNGMHDSVEGPLAFSEKRPPIFTDS